MIGNKICKDANKDLGLEVLTMFRHQLALDPLVHRVGSRADVVHLGGSVAVFCKGGPLLHWRCYETF